VTEESIQAAAPGADRKRSGVIPGESIDRTRLPIRRPPFQGIVNRTLAGSQPDWGQIGHIQPPQGAPNVLLVLIDDAGFGNPGTFGGPVDTPNFTRLAEAGLRYNRFPCDRALLTDAGGAADRAQPSRGRLRLHRGAVQRLPRLHRLRS
jgi:hypothetical protein